MPFDAEELIEQQNKERKREEARIAQMRQWDAPIDQRIVSIGFIYAYVAFVLRFYLAEFFNYQQLEPGKGAIYGGSLDYGLINVSLFFLLGHFNKNRKTWKNMWRPIQYAIALTTYLSSTAFLCRFPPREFHEPQIIQLFFLTALILDIIIVLIFWIHTFKLFRRKYLPDCVFLANQKPNFLSPLIMVVLLIFLLSSNWFGAYIAPGLPKFFH